jgi:predicted NAD/FAD-binding protein
MAAGSEGSQRIAVIGGGVSGLSAGWLLSQRHEVTLYEAAPRLGGHSLTIEAEVGGVRTPVDMGFIVYNELTYPNLTALFAHLGVTTRATDMSFAVSLDDAAVEYGGVGLAPILGRPSNLFKPRFWSMLRDLVRFYRDAPTDRAAGLDDSVTLGDYLDANGYGVAFQDDHILPQAAAIWSAPVEAVRDFPASAFIRFFENHGLLRLAGRPVWRTVVGGSRAYVDRLSEALLPRVKVNAGVRSVRREGDGVRVSDVRGVTERFDAVVIATHAREALAMLHQPTARERSVLGAFRYTQNLAVLHTDVRLMPRRPAVWSGWNYLGRLDEDGKRDLCVTYWMNLLQGLQTPRPLLVTLNPITPPDPAQVLRSEAFEHPLFDCAALAAQRELWSLQGEGGVWFCGAHFGAGFHEDGLQAGLAVAEALGGVRRPWTVANESGRIGIEPVRAPPAKAA